MEKVNKYQPKKIELEDREVQDHGDPITRCKWLMSLGLTAINHDSLCFHHNRLRDVCHTRDPYCFCFF